MGNEFLEGIIGRKRQKWDPAATRKEYRDWKDTWRLYIDLYELDKTRLAALVEKHGANENPEKYAARQGLAAVINLVPSLVDMVRDYLFSEEPRIDTGGDPDLDAFLADCDGTGRPLLDWLRLRALPLSLVMGMVDVVISNPATTDGQVETAADREAQKLKPAAADYTPLDRINWAVTRRGNYQWVTYRDRADENADPLKGDPGKAEAYITFSRPHDEFARADSETPESFWIRSWRPENSADGLDPTSAANPPGSVLDANAARWQFEADYAPTREVPVATLYYKQSVDNERPRFGVSKIAVIAILTKKIIQILSWTDEDILANLALLAIPSKDGRPPRDANGQLVITELNAASIIWYPIDASNPPTVVQGDVGHITAKLGLVQTYITEILRLAHLIGATGEAETTTSGVQAVIQRTELFQELGDVAVGLDNFVMEVFALVKSWASNKHVTREELDKAGVSVAFHKGPYAVDPLVTVLENVSKIKELFARISPTLVRRALENVARAALYADDPAMDDVMAEIKAETPKVLKDETDPDNLAAQAAAAGGGGDGQLRISEVA